jgi:orotate phosphoribosyltransferase
MASALLSIANRAYVPMVAPTKGVGVVEDVITTGGSFREAVEPVQEAGGERADHCLASLEVQRGKTDE